MKSLFAAILLLFACLLPHSAAAAETLALTYDIHAGGFAVAETTVEMNFDGRGGYRLATGIVTDGFLGWLTGFAVQAASLGRLDADGPQPLHHRQDSRWRGETRWAEGRYADEGPPAFTVHPAVEDDEREPVPSSMTEGTVDPLTAGLFMAWMASGASPGGVIPVFDGRRRYDLVVTAVPGAATGEGGRVLDVRLVRKAGFASGGFFRPREHAQTARLWFAAPRPGSGGMAVPVRVESDSPFGAVVVRLIRAEAMAGR